MGAQRYVSFEWRAGQDCETDAVCCVRVKTKVRGKYRGGLLKDLFLPAIDWGMALCKSAKHCCFVDFGFLLLFKLRDGVGSGNDGGVVCACWLGV